MCHVTHNLKKLLPFPGTFNIPKFFEFELTEDGQDYITTLLNENENYIVFCSWWNDLIVLGIIPFVALVVFNMKIYLKVRSSDKLEYRFVGKKATSLRVTNPSSAMTHKTPLVVEVHSINGVKRYIIPLIWQFMM